MSAPRCKPVGLSSTVIAKAVIGKPEVGAKGIPLGGDTFADPIHLKDGRTLRTLADARDLADRTGRQEFQAAGGGDIAAARQSVAMAAFLVGFQLDLTKEPQTRRRD